VKPGEIIIDMEAGAVRANVGRAATTLMIQHTGDLPAHVWQLRRRDRLHQRLLPF
jgi:urease beta subunit